MIAATLPPAPILKKLAQEVGVRASGSKREILGAILGNGATSRAFVTEFQGQRYAVAFAGGRWIAEPCTNESRS